MTSRADVASSFTIVKGAMVAESFSIFASWDFEQTKRENLDQVRRTNLINAASETWLRDVAKVFNRRFDPSGRDRPLALLAKAGWDRDVWKPLLLWHLTRDEFLFRDFLLNWLFPLFESGVLRVRAEELHPYLDTLADRGGRVEHGWSATTRERVAHGLLRMATDFGLLRGKTAREFAPYHLPDESFLYLVHALRDAGRSPAALVHSPDWRMFLMRPADVERELLRLHQFRKLGYEVAGSLVQLTLPYATSSEFAESATR